VSLSDGAKNGIVFLILKLIELTQIKLTKESEMNLK
jgi:hypothetical protein